jgi:hypothetical protein
MAATATMTGKFNIGRLGCILALMAQKSVFSMLDDLARDIEALRTMLAPLARLSGGDGPFPMKGGDGPFPMKSLPRRPRRRRRGPRAK